MHVRPHLDYCDFIYHIPEIKKKENPCEDFDADDVCDHIDEYDNDNDVEISNCKLNYQMRALESLQYQAALAVT